MSEQAVVVNATGTITLTDFLLARIAEDEAFASMAKHGWRWTYSRETGLEEIVFAGRKNRSWRSNIGLAIGCLLPFLRKGWERELMGTRVDFRQAWVALTYKERHLPDGTVNGKIFTFWEEDGEHIERWDPQRVLAECEKNRRIVTAAAAAARSDHREMGPLSDLADVALTALALPYADHPDFRQEWKP